LGTTAPTWSIQVEGIELTFTALAAPPPFFYKTGVTTDLDKTALRTRLRAVRKRLSAELPDAASRAAALLPVARLPRYRVFSLYVPQGSEIDPMPLRARLYERNAHVVLPAAADREAPLVFRLWERGLPLQPDAFGIPAPLPVMPELSPDLVVAPLLGFDRHGARLGQGAGHYDRTLANLRATKPVFVLGLAYSGQEVERLPAEPHDQRLDAILTEREYIPVG
jgi:5-formyltetrahydrofolate cyclo-ligase